MKTSIKNLESQLTLLKIFAAQYNVGDRGYCGIIVSSVTPEVSFDADKHGSWAGETFGKDGWEPKSAGDKYRFTKVVDGVRVNLDRAFGIQEEAGISLPAEWVKPVATYQQVSNQTL